jgi:chemotaxis protein CheC
MHLTPLEHDALTELVNIGVSRAASSLRKMAGHHVLLSVPAVEVITRRTAAAVMVERESAPLVAVRQDFHGALFGRALLIFPEESGRELVSAVAGGELAPEEIETLETETLAEIGNVVLISCLATVANMLQKSVDISLPEVIRGDGALLFEAEDTGNSKGLVLLLYINFSISTRDIRGYIAMLMDLPSLEILKSLIDDFIGRVAGVDPGSAP